MLSLDKYRTEQNPEYSVDEAAYFLKTWGVNLEQVQPLEVRQILLNFHRSSASQAMMVALLGFQEQQNTITE